MIHTLLLVSILALLTTLQPSLVNAYWTPKPALSWQWQLAGNLDTTIPVSMYDIDLFNASKPGIDALHQQGRIVVCYFSAGTYQYWTPDAQYFNPTTLSQQMTNTSSVWLDISNFDGSIAALNVYGNYSIAGIMANRMQYASLLGCDAVQPDNLDAYAHNIPTVTGVNSTGYRQYGSPITADQQTTYNIFLAQTAHAHNLSVGLTNAMSLYSGLQPYYDFAIVESCITDNTCSGAQAFLSANKFVGNVEYTNTSISCATTNQLNIATILKPNDLYSGVNECGFATLSAGPQCGDSICSVGETQSSCAVDCDANGKSLFHQDTTGLPPAPGSDGSTVSPTTVAFSTPPADLSSGTSAPSSGSTVDNPSNTPITTSAQPTSSSSSSPASGTAGATTAPSTSAAAGGSITDSNSQSASQKSGAAGTQIAHTVVAGVVTAAMAAVM